MSTIGNLYLFIFLISYKKIETYKNTNVKNIEDEIKKTEEFLSELKKLKERIEK